MGHLCARVQTFGYHFVTKWLLRGTTEHTSTEPFMAKLLKCIGSFDGHLGHVYYVTIKALGTERLVDHTGRAGKTWLSLASTRVTERGG